MADTSNWVGQNLGDGRFRVMEKLGSGGMGYVYKALDRLGGEVVVKVPRQAMLEDPEFAGRFTREIRSLTRLTHAHIVRILDTGEHEGIPFVVLEHLRGGSLRDQVRKNADGKIVPQPLHELLSWLGQIAVALDFCHAQHCIHRDVKPDNIIFDADETPYLSDFGIAKVLHSSPKTRLTVLTGAGMVLGTPQYMAPELVLGEKYDGRVDQYGLAVTAYEMVSGQVPFDGPTGPAVFLKQISQPVPSLHALIGGIPKGISEAIEKAMAKDPKDRFPNCTIFAQKALRGLKDTSVLAGAPTSPPNSSMVNMAAVLVKTKKLSCPKCRNSMEIPLSAVGQRLQCPMCGAHFTLRDKSLSATPVREQSEIGTCVGDQTQKEPQANRGKLQQGAQAAAPPASFFASRTRILVLSLGAILFVSALIAAVFLLRSSDQPASLQILPIPEITLRPGETRSVSLQVKRTRCRGEVRIGFSGLPEGVKAQWNSLKDDEETTAFEFTVDAESVASTQGIEIEAYSGSIRVAQTFQLTVVPAFAVSIYPVGDLILKPGSRSVVPVKIMRRGFDGDVTIEVQGLPQGVTVMPASISANRDLTYIELTASPNASQGQKLVQVVSSGPFFKHSVSFLLTVQFLSVPSLQSSTRPPPFLSKYLPDTEFLLTINFKQILNSQLLQSQKALVDQAKAAYEKGIGKEMAILDFDLFRDLHSITFAFIPGTKANSFEMLAIVEGRFNAEAFHLAGNVSEIRGFKLVELAPSSPTCWCLINDSLLLVGSARGAIDASLQAATSATTPPLKKGVQDLLNRVDENQSLAIIGTGNGVLAPAVVALSQFTEHTNIANSPALAPLINRLAQENVSIAVSCQRDVKIQIRIETKDEATAKQLALEGNLLGLPFTKEAVKQMVTDDPRLRPLNEVMNTVFISSAGTTFQLQATVTSEVIGKLWENFKILEEEDPLNAARQEEAARLRRLLMEHLIERLIEASQKGRGK